MNPAAWTWSAALICPACAEGKAERDREGNERAPVYPWDASDACEACDLCGEVLDLALTPAGLLALRDAIEGANLLEPLHPVFESYARRHRHAPEIRNALADREAMRERIDAGFIENQAREPGAEGVGRSE